MKIRIKGNSIRFRLTQSEVRQLSETGSITETTEIGNSVFQYQVVLMAPIQNLQVSYSDNTIKLMVPESEGKNWFHNNTVGFEHEAAISPEKKLHLLLEKDFTCLESRTEDQSDNYPNPKLQH
ncbi:MAG: hypothetical protein GYB37_07395 [Algicola sp.]|nr:hypothetical protein [Algicola sp.]